MNFVIRVYQRYEVEKTVIEDNEQKTVLVPRFQRSLVGGGQITKYMDESSAIDQFERCLDGDRSKYTWWNRNVLRIEFIAK